LPQPHAVLSGQPVQSLDRRVQQFGIGRERDGLRLHRGVDLATGLHRGVRVKAQGRSEASALRMWVKKARRMDDPAHPHITGPRASARQKH
jgi:hypothetical protein